jgi:hypothetical protein
MINTKQELLDFLAAQSAPQAIIDRFTAMTDAHAVHFIGRKYLENDETKIKAFLKI